MTGPYRGKRVVDVVLLALVALPALVLAVPSAVAIKLTSTGPVLFRQQRIGRDGRTFSLLKFRTMTTGKNALIPDQADITRVGSVLRRLSLDELPQLINVARDEMSIVGPRPTLAYQVERYTETQRRRLCVNPGVTGWAQLQGRNEIPWARRIEYDLEYIDTLQSPVCDVSILLRSVLAAVAGGGVEGHPVDDPIARPPEEETTMTSQLTPLVIVGAGGHGRETLDVVEAINEHTHVWHFLGFIDDGPVVQDRLDRRGAGLMHRDEIDPSVVRYVIGIGDPMIRSHLAAEMDHAGFTAATLIHPGATVGGDNRLGAGVVLAAGATVTTNVALGSHTQLNVGATASHDCEVGHAVTISPGAYVNGSCHLDDHVFLGTGAIVTPGHYIGAEAVVGAGAVVVDDVPVGITVTGVPARPVSGQHGRIGLETAARLIREDRDSR